MLRAYMTDFWVNTRQLRLGFYSNQTHDDIFGRSQAVLSTRHLHSKHFIHVLVSTSLTIAQIFKSKSTD